MRKTWFDRLVAGVVLGMTLGVAACGGGDASAKDLMPDLDDQGLRLMEAERDTFLPDDKDAYRAIYADRPDATFGVLVAIYVEKSTDEAVATFDVLATALKHPPAVFFGGEAVQVDSEPLELGDQSVAWVTEQPDRSGRIILTDLTRSGRTVLLTQVLGSYDKDHTEFRQLVAERVFDKAP